MPTVINMGDVFSLVRETAASRRLGQEAVDWLARRLPTEVARRTDWTTPTTQADADQNFGEAVPQEVANACRHHVAKAVAQGEPLAQFLAFFAFAEVSAIADWLAALPTEAPVLLAKLPKVTWAQAVEHSRRWHERLARRDANAVSAAALGQGAATTLELDGGWRWVRLETTAALDAEGQAMGHCVGSGGYDGLAGAKAPNGIYSLRDTRGRPHITVEVRDGDIQQAQGRGNTAPTGYASSLQSLVQALGVGIGYERPGLFGLARIGGVLMPVDAALSRALAQLAANGKVDGCLDLSGCTSLVGLPEELVVDGWLDLSRCTSLVGLPEGFKVGGDLDLSGCTSLVGLPEGFKVGGDLYLHGCNSLVGLPERLKVGRNLDLSGCTSLASLPEGLVVDGNLGLSGCTSLASLPEGLKVGGKLNLSGCSSLTGLPEELVVDGWLDLSGCTSLVGLPEGFKVGGDLYLHGCTSLTGLPEDIKVGGILDLGGCTSLVGLPEGLKVGGGIYGADHLPRNSAVTRSPDTGMTR